MSVQSHVIGLDQSDVFVVNPARQDGPGAADILALACPPMLDALQNMSRVTGWLNDSDTALDTLWAVPEQGAASMSHVAARVAWLEDVMVILSALQEDKPPILKEPMPAIKRHLTRRALRSGGAITAQVDLGPGSSLKIADAQIAAVVAAFALLAKGSQGAVVSAFSLPPCVCLQLEMRAVAVPPQKLEHVFDPANPLDLNPLQALAFVALWALGDALGAQIHVEAEETAGMMRVAVVI